MARFRKTSIDVVTAVLILLVLYSLAGFGHALWVRSDESMWTWATIASVASLVAIGNQLRVAKKRRLTQ